ncbi:hypothetical protein T040910_135 [Synechococcus phage S-CAM3]|uniref:Endonuclease VII n=1 Tax=Synechococcus phage S-CAM3 TaxID=1883366 RepID=A0A1D8KKE4_9CAUD|nr:endonuclease VII [Synechococcus phage S-CAM3]AOV58640.1 hypothetical protein S250808_135 [Synechococcus phage S-CAM3]AOV58879.1 hypothetical protein T040910_135 [Synechococcus phage S-CAM3]AOV59118.1 hypothetical protein C421010_135 [Synechococcus phage S-CAM3]
MDVGDLFDLDNLLWKERKCRSCGKNKDLLTDFYRTRKDRTSISAYSYECKDCTKKRITESRQKVSDNTWQYPDW